MAITPTGAPAWTRTVSHTHYGGHVDKQNYLSRGSIDETTDIDAEEYCRLCADTEATVRTAPFAVLRVLLNDTSPAAPTIEAAFLMTGIRTQSYEGDAPPSGFPAAARSADGVITITFASSYADSYGVSGAFAPAHAVPQLHGSAAGSVTWQISGQVVTLTVKDDADAAVQDARVSLVVY